MAIFEKDLEKINILNNIYNKKNLKAELLQLTKIKLNPQKADLQFELDINLDKRFNLNKSYLNLINNNNTSFFKETFNDLSNKSKEIFKANEKLLLQIQNEKLILSNSIDEMFLKPNSFYINLLYNLQDSFDETNDFFNGHFLFNKKIVNIFENVTNNISEGNNTSNYFQNNFSILYNLYDSYNNFITSENENTLNNTEKLKLVFNNINTHINNENRLYDNLNYFCKYYLSHPINLDSNTSKITNFKNYPISIASLSQSIYNLIEQSDFFSNNALLYGIIPFTKLNQLNNYLLTDFPSFQKSINIEYFPLKYLNRKNILLIENTQYKNNIIEHMKSKYIDENTQKIISSDENELIQNNKIFINNNLKDSSIANMINVENILEIESFCNISIQHKSSENYLSNSRNNNFHNKFNFFKNAAITYIASDNNIILNNDNSGETYSAYANRIIITDKSFQQNLRVGVNNPDGIESLVSNQEILDNYDIYNDFKKNAKISNLNLIQLIASNINSNNLKIISIDTVKNNSVITSLPRINSDQLEQIIVGQQNQIGPIINNSNQSSINNSIITKYKGAIPPLMTNKINLLNQTNTVSNNQNTNVNQDVNNTFLNNSNSFKEDTTQRVLYKSKNTIDENIKGLSNFSFFDESNNFSSNIIKNRYLVNDLNKKAKNLILQQSFKSVFLNHISAISGEKIFNNLENNFVYKIDQSIDDIFKNNLNNTQNNFYNYQYIEDTLAFLRTRNNYDGIILKEEFVLLKNRSFMNESSIKFNIDNFNNKNDDFVDLSKEITEQEIKDNFNNNNFSFFDNYFNKEKLKHFSNTYETFKFIVDICKKYISDNLDEKDNLTNFSKRANILETACLLWLFSSNSSFLDKNLKKNIKDELINIILYEKILKIQNKSNSRNEIQNVKKELMKKIMTPDHITDISGFYTYSPNLKMQEYSNYNPYNTQGIDNFFNIFEQNGMFYHWLLSNNVHQTKQYQYKDTNYKIDEIIEYSSRNEINVKGISNYINSPFCFYVVNEDPIRIYFKNIFNSGYHHNIDISNSNKDYNLFLPYIEYEIDQQNNSHFIVSMKIDDTKKDSGDGDINYLIALISNYLNNLKAKLSTGVLVERDLLQLGLNEDIINKLIEKINSNSLIFEKNILNKSTITNTFLNDSNNFISNFINELLNPFENESFYIDSRNGLKNITITTFNNFKNLNNKMIQEIKLILESSLVLCSDIFAKMFIDLQSYNSLCNRIFDANYIYENEKKNNNILKIHKNAFDLIKFSRFLLLQEGNNQNSEYRDSIKYKKNIEENSLRYLNNYFSSAGDKDFTDPSNSANQSFDSLNESSKKIANSESIYKKTKKLKPSEHKFFYFLEKILGIKGEDIIKIYAYLRSDPNQFSKNINVFENFNLFSFPLYKMIYKNQGYGYYAGQNWLTYKIADKSTFTYDFIFEDALINQDSMRAIGYLDQNYSNVRTNLTNLSRLFDIKGDIKIAQNIESVSDENILINSILQIVSGNNVNYSNFKFDMSGHYDAIEDDKYSLIFSKKYNLDDNQGYIENNVELNSIEFKNIISLKDIFEYIVLPSFTLNKDFYNIEKGDSVQTYKTISGCENISIDKNYLNFKNNDSILRNKRYINNDNLFRNIIDNYFKDYNGFNSTVDINLNKKSVDLNHNWYNQICRGLILNDTITAMNMELVKYYNSYDKGIGYDSYKQYQYLQNKRTSGFLNENVLNSYNLLKDNTPLENFKLKNNNFNLKKSYIKNFLQAKKLKNINEKIIIQENESNNISEVINKDILGPDEKNLLLSNFTDFYIRKFKDKNVNSEFKFLKNYQELNQNIKYIRNQTLNLNKCDILTVGIENNELHFENNDVIVLTVEMTDHDYPDIVWESKKFEFIMSIDDIDDEMLQFNQVNSNNFLNIALNDYDISIEENQLLKNLINSSIIGQTENNTNNIDSLLSRKYLNVGVNSDIENIKNKITNRLKEKFNKFKLINNLDAYEFNNAVEGIASNCVYNQILNLKLKKYLKLMNGFEPNIEFSLKLEQYKKLSDLIVLNEVYDLYVNHIFLNLDNSNENSLGFTREDLDNAFKVEGSLNEENTYNIFGYNFKVAALSSNPKINQIVKYMSDFTKAIIPQYNTMASSNFNKIINIAVNPSDFVALSIEDKNHDIQEFFLVHNDLKFNLINNFNNEVYNEWGRIYDNLNRKILLKHNLSSRYYNVAYKDTNEKYIPKNVSYRIKLDLLD